MVAWRAGQTPKNGDTRRRGETAFFLCGFSVAFALFSTAGRACLGLEASLASRYTLYAVPGIFGLYVVARAWPGRTMTSRLVVALIVTLLVFKERFWAFEWRSGGWMAVKKAEWATCYLATRSVTGCNSSTGFPLYPMADAPAIGFELKLDHLEKNRLNMFRGPAPVFESGRRIR